MLRSCWKTRPKQVKSGRGSLTEFECDLMDILAKFEELLGEEKP
jgi:hypothetical protein